MPPHSLRSPLDFGERKLLSFRNDLDSGPQARAEMKKGSDTQSHLGRKFFEVETAFCIINLFVVVIISLWKGKYVNHRMSFFVRVKTMSCGTILWIRFELYMYLVQEWQNERWGKDESRRG